MIRVTIEGVGTVYFMPANIGYVHAAAPIQQDKGVFTVLKNALGVEFLCREPVETIVAQIRGVTA